MFPKFDPIDNPIQNLTFYKEFEGAKFPERGSVGAAGMDFFIPYPTSLDDYAFEFMYNKCKDAVKGREELEKAVDSIFNNLKTYEYPGYAFLDAVMYYNKYVFNNSEIYTGSYPTKEGREFYLILQPGVGVNIPSGIAADIPHGYALDFRNKSGIATKKDLIVGAELVDEDYTGIMHLNIHNIGLKEQRLTCGMKIAQAVIEKTYYDNFIITNNEGKIDKKTGRGDGGFGSTGI